MIARKTSYAVTERRYTPARKGNGAFVVIMLTPTVLGLAAIVASGALALGWTP